MSLEERESRRIVRMYSFDVDDRLADSEARFLGEVLAEDRGDYQSLMAPWRRFFEPREDSEENKNPIMDVIAIEGAKLRQKFSAFQANSPSEERLDLQASEPTPDGVVDLVNSMMRQYQSKRGKGHRGKALGRFHKFCGSLESHSSMIKLLPEGSHYVSLFTGSLNAVIQASVNHERIAEEFSESLCQISDHIVWCKAELDLFKTKAMMELVADLYAHIFLFLSGIMDWIMEKRRKRMLDSFNENFRKRFDDEIEIIRHKAEKIRRLAQQSSHAELRATRLTVEELHADMRIGLVGSARDRAEMRYMAERIEKELRGLHVEREQMREERHQLATCIKLMLEERAMGAFRASGNDYIPLRLLQVEGKSSGSHSPLDLVSQWTSEAVSLNSSHLEDFFHRDRIRLAYNPNSPVLINQNVLRRMSQWAGDASDKILWLEAPYMEADDFENPATVIASKFVDLSSNFKVPVISYFCEIRRGESLRTGNTRETQATIATTYALLRQVIELLPPRFDADHIDLSEKSFSSLDGTPESFEKALHMFRGLVSLVGDSTFCVIDGLQWLDDSSTSAHLAGFLNALRGSDWHVLLTTSGRSSCLREHISASETQYVDTLDERAGDVRMDEELLGGGRSELV